jgi:hypothetical protein
MGDSGISKVSSNTVNLRSEELRDVLDPDSNRSVLKLSELRLQWLKNYANTGQFMASCVKIDRSRATIEHWITNDPEFRRMYELAKAQYLERLEAVADRRAVVGVRTPIVYQGRVTGAYFKPSDSLLELRLKRLDPAYRDSVQVDNTSSKVNVQIISIERASRQVVNHTPDTSQIDQGKGDNDIAVPVEGKVIDDTMLTELGGKA